MPPLKPHARHLDAAEALAVTAPLVTRWVERALAELEPPLTVAQYEGLRAIAAGGATVASLAQRTSTSASATSQLVAGLERANLIERAPEPRDRRRESLRVSETGEQVLLAASSALRHRLSPIVGSLAGPEAQSLLHLLERVEVELGLTPPPPRPRRPPHPPRR